MPPPFQRPHKETQTQPTSTSPSSLCCSTSPSTSSPSSSSSSSSSSSLSTSSLPVRVPPPPRITLLLLVSAHLRLQAVDAGVDARQVQVLVHVELRHVGRLDLHPHHVRCRRTAGHPPAALRRRPLPTVARRSSSSRPSTRVRRTAASSSPLPWARCDPPPISHRLATVTPPTPPTD